MKRLIEVGLNDGGVVLVEVEDAQEGRALRGGGASAPVVEAAHSLDGVMSQLGSLTEGMLGRARTSPESPDEIEVEFSVKLTAQARVVIAQTGGEANFRVAMRWLSDKQART